MFANLDQILRELGVGDMSRAQEDPSDGVKPSMAAPPPTTRRSKGRRRRCLARSVARNVYRGADMRHDRSSTRCATYVRAASEALKAADDTDILARHLRLARAVTKPKHPIESPAHGFLRLRPVAKIGDAGPATKRSTRTPAELERIARYLDLARRARR